MFLKHVDDQKNFYLTAKFLSAATYTFTSFHGL
jgi:hypothetical protein